MDHQPAERLRILIADSGLERLRQIGESVESLGHDVVVRETALERIGDVTRVEKPDVAIVVVGESSDRALNAIGKIVREATCPVITILDVEDPAFVTEAAKRGVFAYITGGADLRQLQGSIDIALRRFTEYHDLEGAFARRSITERAKGVLMERHSIDERAAFALLRDEARKTNKKIVEIAEAVVSSHQLLPGEEKPLS